MIASDRSLRFLSIVPGVVVVGLLLYVYFETVHVTAFRLLVWRGIVPLFALTSAVATAALIRRDQCKRLAGVFWVSAVLFSLGALSYWFAPGWIWTHS